MKIKKIRVIFLMLAIIMLIGCGSNKPKLTGKWVYTDETISESFEFFSDGTGTLTEDDISCAFTWTVEGERLKIDLDMGFIGTSSHVVDYEIKDDTLTITEDTGKSVTYIKQ